MMYDLIHALFRFFLVLKNNAGTGIAKQRIFVVFLVVDLVKSHPVFHFVLITLHDGHCVLYKEIDELTVFPSAVLFTR